jgi:hypothetical protein
VDEVDGNDVAGELANILCCHVLPNLFTARALFQVESPRPHEGPPPRGIARRGGGPRGDAHGLD